MNSSLLMFLNVFFIVGQVYPAVFTPFFSSHLLQQTINTSKPFKLSNYLIVIIQMKGKGISFAQVLMKKDRGHETVKPKCTSSLLEILNRWEENPNAEYTLYLDESSTSKQRTSQNLLISKTSKGGMFDSWIERQGLQNKQNTDSMSNRYANNWEEFGQQKILLHSKGQKKNIPEERREFTNNFVNNNRSSVNQIELSTNNNHYQELYDSKENSKSSCLSVGIDCGRKPPIIENLKSTNINSFREMNAYKKNFIKNNEEDHLKFNKNSGKEKFNELQQLVQQTDNIHQEIAELAHKFVLEEKKKSQEQQELLLSIEQAKRLSLREKKNSEKERERQKTWIKENQQKKEEQNRNRLKEQTKMEIKNFLKNAQTKLHVPTFGGKSQGQQKSLLKENEIGYIKQIQFTKNSRDGLHNQVGYSFSTNLLQQPVKQSIPELHIPETTTIPMIQEIASERHPSETNQQIENMYNKWKQQEAHQHIVSQNIQNIESVNFFKMPESQQDNNYDDRQQKQQKNQIERIIDEQVLPVRKVSVEDEQTLEQKFNFKESSSQKPEINVNIPYNFNQQRSEDFDLNSSEKLRSSEEKKQLLVLSPSSKKCQSHQKEDMAKGQEEVNIKLFTNENSDKQDQDSLRKVEARQKNELTFSNPPNRDLYLSVKEEGEEKEEEEKQLGERQNIKQSQIPQVSQIQPEVHILADNKTKQPEQELPQKQSPSHCFKTYGLYKVYSNGKKDENTQSNVHKEVKTSQFASNQVHLSTNEMDNKRSDMKQFSFGHTYNPMNHFKVQNKDGKTNSQGKSSGKKIVLTGSNKSKDKKNSIKIESYAHTTMFSTNPQIQSQKEPDNCLTKNQLQQENQEFNFDF